MILKLILITVVLMAIAFALIGIKMFFVKDGVFTKTCSSDLVDQGGKKMDCMCEKDPEYVCDNYDLHHGEGAESHSH